MREKKRGSTGTVGPSGPTWPLRWTRVGFRLVVAAAALSVLAGATVAAGWLNPGTIAENAADEQCESPPCLPESLPDPASVPIALPLVLIALAAVLGAPTLLVGLLTLFRGGRRLFSTGLLVTVGPLLVLVGTEIVPHVANPCLLGEVSTICASTEQYGVDFADRFHALGHAVIGTLPFTVAYWWVLRRWRPEVLRR